MALVIPSTELVTTVSVVRQIEEKAAASKEIVAAVFDFRSTVGYIIINTLDANGVVLEQQLCKVSGPDYATLVGRSVDAGILANIVLTEISTFVQSMDFMQSGITPMLPNELAEALIGLMAPES